MELNLVDNFVMPATTRTGRNGSKYLSDATLATMQKMVVGQGFILPTIGETDTPANKAKSCDLTFKNFPWYAKQAFLGTGKTFTFGKMADSSGVACKCTAVLAPEIPEQQDDAPDAKDGE